MKRQLAPIIAILGAIFMVASPPAWVHHSGAMFDRTRTIQITGIVTEFNWANPHSSFKVEVTGGGGKVETWAVEMNGPNNLVHEGWKRTTIKAGDKVTVTVNPLRDGRPGGWYVAIALPDGKSLNSNDAPAGGTPAGG